MKTLFALVFSFVMIAAPVKESKASDITTSVVVGVLVAHYAGTLAGVAASSLLAGTAVVLHSKEAALKEAQNDVQSFNATGTLSLNLQNSVNSIQALDESISDEEAMDMIVASLQ